MKLENVDKLKLYVVREGKFAYKATKKSDVRIVTVEMKKRK